MCYHRCFVKVYIPQMVVVYWTTYSNWTTFLYLYSFERSENVLYTVAPLAEPTRPGPAER